MIEQPVVFLLASIVLGLLTGSFLNVVILRLPARLAYRWRPGADERAGNTDHNSADTPPPGLLHPPSRCSACASPIRWFENIPLFSYLALAGRCSSCKARISLRYPAVELLTGVLTVTTVALMGMEWPVVPALLLTWALIALSFIDVDQQILPDAITLPLLWLGLLANTFGGFVSLEAAVIGAVVGYLALWMIYQAFRWVTGRVGFGYGDFKLLAALGAWLGWQALPLVVFLASATGVVFGLGLMLFRNRPRGQRLAFGPYLACAGWATLLFGDSLIAWYRQLAGISG